jgi:hypothetical protein
MLKRHAPSTFLAIALAVACVVALMPTILGAGPVKTGANRYLIVAPHTPDQCLKTLDDMEAMSPALLDKMEWGCMTGDHTGYAFVDAASEEAARNLLPASERAQAKVIKLNKFTAEQIKSFHNKK